LVEAFFPHGFDGFGTGGGSGDCGDRFEAEGGDCGAMEGVVFNGGSTAMGGFGLWSQWGCGWEEVICCEPVVVNELWIWLVIWVWKGKGETYFAKVAADAIWEDNDNHVVFTQPKLFDGLDSCIHCASTTSTA
jgi:hypothetical protein